MTVKLEPCPFCGGENLTILDNGESRPGTYWVACKTVGCEAEGPWRREDKPETPEAILAWNRRAKKGTE